MLLILGRFYSILKLLSEVFFTSPPTFYAGYFPFVQGEKF
jgi:hypothetical protein